MLTNTLQYAHNNCVTSCSWLQRNAGKMLQNLPWKMHHPVCEIWLACNRARGSPLRFFITQYQCSHDHPFYSCKWTSRWDLSCSFVQPCFLLLSTGRLVFVYKAKKTCLSHMLKNVSKYTGSYSWCHRSCTVMKWNGTHQLSKCNNNMENYTCQWEHNKNFTASWG